MTAAAILGLGVYLGVIYALGRVAERRGRRSWVWMLIAACTIGVFAFIPLLLLRDLSEPVEREPALPGGHARWWGVALVLSLLIGVLFAVQPTRWWILGKPADVQLAGLVDKSVRKAGPTLIGLGVDPKAIRVHSDCSKTSSGHSITYYGCFAYLSEGATTLPVQYEGYVRSNGEMGVWPKGHSPEQEAVEHVREQFSEGQ